MRQQKKRVLIVDDDRDIRLGLGLRLRDMGYEPLFAENCVGALVTACADAPDLILLDVGLPGDNGHVVLEQLAAIPQAEEIPVFMISAMDPCAHEPRSLRGGASVFFRKPIDEAHLFYSIEAEIGPGLR